MPDKFTTYFGETVLALETGTYISDLVVANPTHTDGLVQGDGHLRLIKNTLKASFPGVTGAVTATHTALNQVLGLVGEPRLWLADTLPTVGTFGWLNGQAISRTTYPVLFALWGTKYGVGDGSTTFNVPNFRDVVPIGNGNMGGAGDRGLIANSGPTAGITTTGSLLGEGAHTLTAAELAPHQHGYSGTTGGSATGTGTTGTGTTGVESVPHTHGVSLAGATASGFSNPTVVEGNSNSGPLNYTTGTESAQHTHAVPGLSVPSLSVPGLAYSGSTDNGTGVAGSAHNNVQPSIVCNWITLLG